MDRFQNTRQPDWDWWGKLWPTPGATLRRLGITADKTLAEVGCGNGYFTLPAARITDPASVMALDIDESLLDELTHLADQQEIENIVPIQGDARELSEILPEPVDTVLIANTFHGIDETTQFVRQAFDSLRPGGQLIIVNWYDLPSETTTIDGDPRGPPAALRLSPEETKTIVQDAADCSLEQHRELAPYHYALVYSQNQN